MKRSFDIVNFLAAIAVAVLCANNFLANGYAIGLFVFMLSYWIDDFIEKRHNIMDDATRLSINTLNLYVVAASWMFFIFAALLFNKLEYFKFFALMGLLFATISLSLNFGRYCMYMSMMKRTQNVVRILINLALMVALYSKEIFGLFWSHLVQFFSKGGLPFFIISLAGAFLIAGFNISSKNQ